MVCIGYMSSPDLGSILRAHGFDLVLKGSVRLGPQQMAVSVGLSSCQNHVEIHLTYVILD